jgi:hypothetical protein
MECKECFKYSECWTIRKLKEIIEQHKREREEIKQLRLTDDSAKWKEKRIALKHRQRGEILEIMEERDKCLRKRAYLAKERGYRYFTNPTHTKTNCQ